MVCREMKEGNPTGGFFEGYFVNNGALDGIKVLDLSRVLAGPTATQILGDLGADVIKVERPGQGDDTRAWGPPFVRSNDCESGDASYFLAANRNKRSISINISDARGAALLQQLADQSDIVVENFRTGGLARYGLDYVTLSARNPRLVYCSVTGFGQTGPAAERAGYDFVVQAMGGLMSITGLPDQAHGGQPMKVGVAVADLFTGVYSATAILAALHEAQRSGLGQHVDMALFDVQVSMLANQAASFLATGVPPDRLGNAHPSLAPYELLPTQTENLVVAVGNDRQFQTLCRVLGVPGIAHDMRFATNAARVENRSALVEALGPALRARSAEDWSTELEAAGVPCGPVRTIDEVFEDPQAEARGLVVQQESDRLTNPVRTVASPIRLSRTPVSYRLAPPGLGEHTDVVLSTRLGLSEAQIAQLREAGVIG